MVGSEGLVGRKTKLIAPSARSPALVRYISQSHRTAEYLIPPCSGSTQALLQPEAALDPPLSNNCPGAYNHLFSRAGTQPALCGPEVAASLLPPGAPGSLACPWH